jgi:hypothetical protein
VWLSVTPLVATAQAPAAPVAITAANTPVNPGRAFFQSLLVPGLAQAKLDRPAGIIFVATELLALTMYAKSTYDYRTARAFSRDSTPLRYTIDPTTGLPATDPESGAPVVAAWAASRYTEGRVRARRLRFWHRWTHRGRRTPPPVAARAPHLLRRHRAGAVRPEEP